ncbi:UDP-glucose 4-epimerase GalE [Desulfobaculum bizertense]|uniref:UDP-glucose 4-epimerase GalE n=1 Tax=Desulfobaculum bizertense TaxID=376490 RepID=UPI001F3AF13D|nr:UDP-glucose 4-epimerase GalE [Desulfobaculum bizertense]UIJ39116.1 UDP-glucose 4-epimerase GalE [Desulfobaculum bizertense]
MERTRILVTGGAGYIGSHTCKALSAAGFEPVTVDSMVRGHEWAVQWGPLVKADIRDVDAMTATFEKYRPAAVIHFAAFIEVGESVADPATFYDNNVWGTLCLLRAMQRGNCPNIVFSSSAAVYGTPEQTPIREDHPLNPINPYGRTKLMMEQIMADFDPAYGTHHVALRYFNAAGADPDGGIGEAHNPETHLVPLAIGSALKTRGHLKVFGQDYDTPDGTCVRDYVHVSDLAQAHVASVRYLLDGGKSTALNLGTGTGNSVLEIIEAVHRAGGVDVPYENAARRAGDPARLVATSTKAQSVLGWEPKYTDIDTIVQTAWRWHLSRKDA